MNSYIYKCIFVCLSILFFTNQGWAQTDDVKKSEIKTDDLSDLLNDPAIKKKEFITSTFKTTRIINSQSIENTAKGVLDFKISHRFSPVSGGVHDFFGLDGASMRLGFDYGISNFLAVGVGRSSLNKEYDVFLKARILRQTAKNEHPLSISYVTGMSVTSLPASQILGRQLLASENFPFSNRIISFYQVLLARKFSDKLSIQLMPTQVHYNFVDTKDEPNDIYALGTAASVKITNRTRLNLEYIYQFSKLNGTVNSLSIGFDLETGGHVFQLFFTNSMGMTEGAFIGQTTDKWQKGDFRFGFNISRIFTIVQPREFENSRNKIY